ncbi:MAG: hypothetical protein RIQ94_1265 [Pseudomonadota bacterium]|jgi:hypothetical protein
MELELESDTKLAIENALQELIDANEKINIYRVAAKAGFSNALIHNRYPDLAFKINEAKANQKQKKDSIDSTCEIERLKKEVAQLKQRTDDSKQNAVSFQKINEDLWEHIQQVYRMYDQILAERNDFAQRLKHYQ